MVSLIAHSSEIDIFQRVFAFIGYLMKPQVATANNGDH